MNTSDADFQRIMTTLWYLWKTRNDIRFQRKKWSVFNSGFHVMPAPCLNCPTFRTFAAPLACFRGLEATLILLLFLITSGPMQGLGIFILDPTHYIKSFTKAHINQATSVLMAEATSIALVASITSLLHIRSITFLTDNQVLVDFFNGNELCSPPH